MELKLWDGLHRLVLASFFFDTGGFPRKASQVEQTGSSYFTSADYLNFLDVWRKKRENTLGSDLVRHFSYSESLASARVSALQYHALELLDTLFVTFTDLHVNIHCVASSKSRN